MINEYYEWHSVESITYKQKSADYLKGVKSLLIQLLIAHNISELKKTLENLFEHKIETASVKIWTEQMEENTEEKIDKFIEEFKNFGGLGFCPFI